MGEKIVCKIVTVSDGGSCYASGKSKDGKTFNSYGQQTNAKLILRPLSDIKEEEHLHMMANFPSIDKDVNMAGAEKDAIKCQYMLSKQFDLFGLIKSGIAIDKNTLI